MLLIKITYSLTVFFSIISRVEIVFSCKCPLSTLFTIMDIDTSSLSLCSQVRLSSPVNQSFFFCYYKSEKDLCSSDFRIGCRVDLLFHHLIMCHVELIMCRVLIHAAFERPHQVISLISFSFLEGVLSVKSTAVVFDNLKLSEGCIFS